MKKKNVLLILGAPEGGVGTHISSILKSLKKTFNFYLLTSLDKADQSFLADMPLYTSDMHDILSIKIEKKPSLYDLKNIYTLYKHYRDLNIDIIHGHGAKGGLYARILGKLLHTKVIYTPHGGSLHQMHGTFKNIFYKRVEGFLFHFTDKIIFESNYTKNIYTDKINSDTTNMLVNYNGVKIVKCTSITQNEPKSIISSFGTLRHLKGHDLLIKAVALLLHKGLDIHLIIYGDGEERENLTKLINTLNITKKATLYGHVEDVEKYMLSSKLIVHPSRFEALPYVPLEAMNLCRPVIVSNVGGLEEIVQHNKNGLVFQNGDIKDLAEKIEMMITDRHNTSNLIHNAKETVSNQFNEVKMLEVLSTVYLNIDK